MEGDRSGNGGRTLSESDTDCVKIRHYISPEVKVMYAYYASDNPLETAVRLHRAVWV